MWYKISTNGNVKPVGVLSINRDGSYSITNLKEVMIEIKGAIDKGLESLNKVFESDKPKTNKDGKKVFWNKPYRN